MRILAVAGFIATAVGAGIEVVLSGLVIPGAIFVAIPLTLAALVWLRSDRLSLGLAALVAALFLYGNVTYSVTLARLQHLEQLGPFVDAALRTLGLLAALIGSAAAAIIRQGPHSRSSVPR
jgi:hypothetical protein